MKCKVCGDKVKFSKSYGFFTTRCHDCQWDKYDLWEEPSFEDRTEERLNKIEKTLHKMKGVREK